VKPFGELNRIDELNRLGNKHHAHFLHSTRSGR
jgi:hypothetical protein